MIKAIFETGGDGICVDLRRESQSGEYAIETTPSQWTKGFISRFYRDNAGTFEPLSDAEILAILQAEQDAADAIIDAEQDVEGAYQASGFANLTVAQADAWVVDQLPSNVTDVTTARQAILGLKNICDMQNRVIIWMKDEIKKRI